jgi:hypothetical protein
MVEKMMREKLRKIQLQERDTRGSVFNGSHEKYQSSLQGSLGRWSEDDYEKRLNCKEGERKDGVSLGRSEKYHGKLVELLGRWWRR